MACKEGKSQPLRFPSCLVCLLNNFVFNQAFDFSIIFYSFISNYFKLRDFFRSLIPVYFCSRLTDSKSF